MNTKELKSTKLYKEYSLEIPYKEIDIEVDNKINQKWGERWDSNPRHQAPQACALTN